MDAKIKIVFICLLNVQKLVLFFFDLIINLNNFLLVIIFNEKKYKFYIFLLYSLIEHLSHK